MIGLLGKVFGKVGGELMGYLDRRGERQLTEKIALQQRMENSFGDELIIIFFLGTMSLFFIPGAQDFAARGFMLMEQSLPPSFQENWHIIIASVFGLDAAKFGIKNFAKSSVARSQNNNGNHTNGKIPREF